MRRLILLAALLCAAPAAAQTISYPPVDASTLMTRAEADVTIATLQSHQPVLLADVTLAQSGLLSVQLSGVRDFIVSVACLPGDRLIMTPTETSPPPAGFMLGDIRCSSAGGSAVAKLLLPQLGVGVSYSITARVTAFR
jgi:hypothetical protein